MIDGGPSEVGPEAGSPASEGGALLQGGGVIVSHFRQACTSSLAVVAGTGSCPKRVLGFRARAGLDVHVVPVVKIWGSKPCRSRVPGE